LTDSPDLGYRVVGALAENGNALPADVQSLGKIGDLREVLNTTSVDEVFYAASIEGGADINDLVFACEEVGVRFSVLADWFRPNIAQTSLRSLGELPLLTFSTTPSQIGQLLIKAVLDKVAAGLAIIVLSPLLAAIAAIIRLTSAGPVLFGQVRSGLNGRLFKMYKFRTMVANAEALRADLEHRNEMSGPVFKIADDPRVTWIGKLLRRYSPGRTAAVVQRVARRHEPGRTAPADPRRSEKVRTLATPPAVDETRPDLLLANRRPQRHRLFRVDGTRPQVHRPLVARARLHHSA